MLSKDQLQRSVDFYQQSNLASIALCNDLRARFNDASQNYGVYGNIFGLFFHDLVSHFTSILILRDYLGDYRGAHISPGTQNPQFPFTGQQYAVDPFKIDNNFDFVPVRERNIKSRLKECAFLKVAVGEAIPLSRDSRSIARKLFSLLTSFQKPEKAFLPRRSDQIDLVKNTINEWSRAYAIRNVNAIIENWDRYMRCNTSQSQVTITKRGAIVGTRALVNNRSLAINYLQQGKPVLGLTHGEINNTVFNEPFFGYSEMSHCSVLLDFGDSHYAYEHNEPLTKPGTILSRSSRTVMNLFRPNSFIKVDNFKNSKKLYIPTSYSGELTYGPFRAYEDGVYQYWQRALLKLTENLTLKAHPKSPLPEFAAILETRWLERCIEEYDVLILDYYSTAATIAMHTDKPIIYFDIGLRNIHSEYLDLLRQRCHYYKVNLYEDVLDQIREVFQTVEETNQTYSNLDLKGYSIRLDEKEALWSSLQDTFY